jgi:hypothetical protein
MAQFRIKRNSEYNNYGRNIRLYLDGEKIGKIKNGEEIIFDQKPGKHLLQAKIDWCSSNKMNIDLTENNVTTIELSGFKYGSLLIPVLGLLLLIFFIPDMFDVNYNLNYILFLAIPLALYFLYYLTIGMNNYLRLKGL